MVYALATSCATVGGEAAVPDLPQPQGIIAQQENSTKTTAQQKKEKNIKQYDVMMMIKK